MTDKKMLENVNRLGFPMMEPGEAFDVNKALAEVVESEDMRLWEGFPVMLANASEESFFDLEKVAGNLQSDKAGENFRSLLLLSLALYEYQHLSFSWAKRLKKDLTAEDRTLMKGYRNQLTHAELLSAANVQFHVSRLKGTFNLYFERNVEKMRQLKEKHEELSLEYALSQLFSPKQKELFKKKLEGEPLSKTEREYYSRTVKKKVSALANPELHRLAQRLMEY